MRLLTIGWVILSFSTFVATLIGWYILDWAVTSCIPPALISLVQTLQGITASAKSGRALLALRVLFVLQFLLCFSFLFDLITISAAWKWMLVFLLFGIHLRLLNWWLNFRKANRFNLLLFGIPSLLFFFGIVFLLSEKPGSTLGIIGLVICGMMTISAILRAQRMKI